MNKYTIRLLVNKSKNKLNIVNFVLYENGKIFKIKSGDIEDRNFIIHNNLNCPSIIFFSADCRIVNCNFLFNNEMHRINGPAFFDAAIGYRYFLNNKQYDKINYYLELAKRS